MGHWSWTLISFVYNFIVQTNKNLENMFTCYQSENQIDLIIYNKL